MNNRKIPLTLDCGLDVVGEVLYGKWKVRILYFISKGHKRPSAIMREIPDASQRVIYSQLKELEEHQLISKVIYPVIPPKVEYNLTELGQSLIPVITILGEWGDTHQDELKRIILKGPHTELE